MGYQKKIRITTSMTDYSQGLSVIGALRIVEDFLCDFFASLGIDNPTVRKNYGAFWVFSKNKVDFLEKVAWGEELTVKCFFTKISAASIVTTLLFQKEGGNIALSSSVECCFISVTDGKILPIKTLDFDKTCATATNDRIYEKFDAPIGGEATVFKVSSTSIDYSMHTNNVEYLQYVLGQYSVEELTTSPVLSIEAHYLRQTFEGDELKCYRSRKDGEDVFALYIGEAVALKARVIR